MYILIICSVLILSYIISRHIIVSYWLWSRKNFLHKIVTYWRKFILVYIYVTHLRIYNKLKLIEKSLNKKGVTIKKMGTVWKLHVDLACTLNVSCDILIFVYLSLVNSLQINLSWLNSCSVSWGCRIHWLHLCRGVRPPPNECPGYDTKQSDGQVPAVLELWRMRSTPSLPSLPVQLWPGVVAPERALSMG